MLLFPWSPELLPRVPLVGFLTSTCRLKMSGASLNRWGAKTSLHKIGWTPQTDFGSNSVIARRKSNYYRNLINDNAYDLKKLWQVLLSA